MIFAFIAGYLCCIVTSAAVGFLLISLDKLGVDPALDDLTFYGRPREDERIAIARCMLEAAYDASGELREPPDDTI